LFNHCLPCAAQCANCTGSQSSCTRCATTDTFVSSLTDACVRECEPGTFAHATKGVCAPCALECATCNGPWASNCTSCIDGLFLRSDGLCDNACPTGTAGDSATGRCVPCHDSCFTC